MSVGFSKPFLHKSVRIIRCLCLVKNISRNNHTIDNQFWAFFANNGWAPWAMGHQCTGKELISKALFVPEVVSLMLVLRARRFCVYSISPGRSIAVRNASSACAGSSWVLENMDFVARKPTPVMACCCSAGVGCVSAQLSLKVAVIAQAQSAALPAWDQT